MQGNDNVLEEDDVLVPEGHGEATDDAGEDIEELCGAIELVGLVDEAVEALIHGLPYHLSSRDQLANRFILITMINNGHFCQNVMKTMSRSITFA